MDPLLPVKAIAFDVFGTLVDIQSPSHVYRDILARMPPHLQPAARQAVMANRWTLAEAVIQMGAPVGAEELANMKARLADELASVVCFPETRAVLAELNTRGYRLALCSNLAQPYAAPVQELVGDYFDVKVWSFAAGALKPEKHLYQRLCNALALPPEEVLMVGDSHVADYLGARNAGLHARHLTRQVPRASLGPERIGSLLDVLRLVL
jgi:HAD superfamily hydrolase (TIGR01493 family)